MSTYVQYPPSAPSSGGDVTSVNGQVGVVVLTAADVGAEPAFANGNLTDAGTDGIVVTNGTGAVIGSGTSIAQHVSDTTHNGYLSAADWNTFNSKLDASRFNYITNPDAELDLSGWVLYDNTSRTVPAAIINQDLTYTSALSGNAGNGVNIQYVYNAGFPSSTPNINVVSPSLVQVRWNNGPTLANNPTATQLKAAWDAVPAALAVATTAITGTASRLQYITGNSLLANGGTAAPTDGTGGSPPGIVLSRNTSTPLVGVATFDLAKDAADRSGEGASSDFQTNAADKGNPLQISFYYQASAGFVLGSASDVRVFLYDITNAVMLPIVTTNILRGPSTGTIYRYAGQFTASSTSVNYRLILHIATPNATAWDLLYDGVSVSPTLDAAVATQVPSVVLQAQPISGAVNNTNGPMCVAWTDGATQWVPATSVFNGDVYNLFGFAKNIVASTADIYIAGQVDGFSFGPFAGYNQYVDPANAGLLTPLPSPLTDTQFIVGKGISSTVLDIKFAPIRDLITTKGGLLTNAGANNGTGDQVLAVGANGSVAVANSAAALGINWAPAVVAGTGLVYTLATRTLTLSALAGDVTGAPQTNTIAAATVTGKLITGFVSGSGTVAATDTILQAINKLNGNNALKANAASAALTGTVTSSGSMQFTAIGTNIQVKTGTNAKIGTAALVAGVAVVANTSVTANSRIFVTSNTDGGTPGWLRVSAKVVATSFTITSSSATDTSTAAWMIVESIP